MLVAAALLAVVAIVGAALALSGGGDDDEDGGGAAGSTDTTAPEVDVTEGTEAPDSTPPGTEAVEEGPTVAIDHVSLEGGQYLVDYTIFGYEPADAPEALHTHFFLDTTDPANAGSNGSPPGDWHLTYESGSFLTKYGPDNQGDATQMCAVVADHGHGVVDPGSASCFELPA